MSYQIVDDFIKHSDAELSAAEAHGMATGMLCVDGRVSCHNWLTELFGNELPVIDEEHSVIVELFKQTAILLENSNFEFDLFLPDEDCSLLDRVEALKFWCQGFLFGVGYAQSSGEWPGDVGEVLKDVVEFTKLDIDVHSEEDENHFMEICEYLRAAVALVYSELNQTQSETKH